MALYKVEVNKVIGSVALFFCCFLFFCGVSCSTNPVVWQISYTFTQLFPLEQDYIAALSLLVIILMNINKLQ